MTRAYVVLAKWPFSQLTLIGKVTHCITCGEESHIGILITDATPAQIRAHSEPSISHPSARNDGNVTFDFFVDKLARFQGVDNVAYWTPAAEVALYPVVAADASAVHAACVAVARLRPFNSNMYRINRLLGGCWPCACWPSSAPGIAPSHCAALTMRIIAYAANDPSPLTSDATALDVLGIPSGGAYGCGPRRLIGFTPRSAVDAMLDAGAIGPSVGGFGPLAVRVDVDLNLRANASHPALLLRL